jgi:hypothetical protein
MAACEFLWPSHTDVGASDGASERTLKCAKCSPTGSSDSRNFDRDRLKEGTALHRFLDERLEEKRHGSASPGFQRSLA